MALTLAKYLLSEDNPYGGKFRIKNSDLIELLTDLESEIGDDGFVYAEVYADTSCGIVHKNKHEEKMTLCSFSGIIYDET